MSYLTTRMSRFQKPNYIKILDKKVAKMPRGPVIDISQMAAQTSTRSQEVQFILLAFESYPDREHS